MGKTIFVSDFDATITQRDFFLLFMDRFLGEEGRWYLSDYRQMNNPSYQFLNDVFAMHRITVDEYRELVAAIRWDENFPEFLKLLAEKGIDHLILSAGTELYIKDAIALRGLPPQRIISNQGVLADGYIRLQHDKASPFFSEQYGIDKGKVIRWLRSEYDRIYFAGDSLPDVSAAEEADVVFAKAALRRYYQDDTSGRIRPFENYAEIMAVFDKKQKQ